MNRPSPARRIVLACSGFVRILFPASFKPLLIIGHMRSGSSLLLHLLSSHPDIAGFGETHRKYRQAQDFDGLGHDVKQTLHLRRLPAWVLDKCLDLEQLSDEIFGLRDCRFLFLLREPVGTLQSMIRQFPTWFSDRLREPLELRELAFENYTLRLNEIQRQSTLLTNERQAAVITHDDLLHRTDSAFQLLEDWLGLSQPLRETYRVTPLTGVGGLGDRSVHIQAGHIVRQIQRTPIELAPAQLLEAEKLYLATRQALSARCLCLAASGREGVSDVTQVPELPQRGVA